MRVPRISRWSGADEFPLVSCSAVRRRVEQGLQNISLLHPNESNARKKEKEKKIHAKNIIRVWQGRGDRKATSQASKLGASTNTGLRKYTALWCCDRKRGKQLPSRGSCLSCISSWLRRCLSQVLIWIGLLVSI